MVGNSQSEFTVKIHTFIPRNSKSHFARVPRVGQSSIHRNIVNVPSDVNSTVYCLPRPISDLQTIPKKLTRHFSYKHQYQFQNVRTK